MNTATELLPKLRERESEALVDNLTTSALEFSSTGFSDSGIAAKTLGGMEGRAKKETDSNKQITTPSAPSLIHQPLGQTPSPSAAQMLEKTPFEGSVTVKSFCSVWYSSKVEAVVESSKQRSVESSFRLKSAILWPGAPCARSQE